MFGPILWALRACLTDEQPVLSLISRVLSLASGLNVFAGQTGINVKHWQKQLQGQMGHVWQTAVP